MFLPFNFIFRLLKKSLLINMYIAYIKIAAALAAHMSGIGTERHMYKLLPACHTSDLSSSLHLSHDAFDLTNFYLSTSLPAALWLL